MKKKLNFKHLLASFILVCILLAGQSLTIFAETLDEETPKADISSHNLVAFDISGIAYYKEARSLIAKVNELRTSLGLDPLVYNMQLEDLAFLRAAESSIYWDHRRPDGSFLYETNQDIHGENLEVGVGNADLVFDNWLHSQGHYENMVNPEYKSIGIGAYSSIHGEAPRWWSQVFSTSLPENNLVDRQDSSVISHRIMVDSELLELEIQTGSQINAGISSDDFGQDRSLRAQVGDKAHLYGMARYKLEGAYSWPGSIPQANLEWEVEDPEIARINKDGELECLALGKTTIKLKHLLLDDLSTELNLQVLATDTFALSAKISQEKAQTLQNTIEDYYLLLPPVSEYLGESTPEANAKKEMAYSYYEQIEHDSSLQALAYDLVKQYSLFMYPDSMESLPGINQILENLPHGYRIAWHAFSNLDSYEDQSIKVPGWAQSYAAIVLESGGADVSFIIYSDMPADGEILAFEDLVDEEEIKDQDGSIRYQVALFHDRDDYSLHFIDQAYAVAQIDVYDPNDFRFRQNDHGQLIYTPQLLIRRDEFGPFPPVHPDSRYLQFSIDQPELAGFTTEGELLIKGQGSFILSVDLVDPNTLEVLCRGEVLVNNYVAIPEYEAPNLIPGETTDETDKADDSGL